MLFVQNCAGCHRNDGTGGGAWAAGLDPPPADLTALAAQGFDRTRILSVIDEYDRTGLPGHQMPEFGTLMRGDSVPVELNDGSLSPVPRPPGGDPDLSRSHSGGTHMKRLYLLAFLATPATAQDAELGAALYARHCATCHGADAQGRGPMASVLTLQPTDLTLLTTDNDGIFPMLRVIDRIDGSDPLVSHGSPMPIYGEFFAGVQDKPLKTHTGQPILVSEPIADLVTYLQNLQAE